MDVCVTILVGPKVLKLELTHVVGQNNFIKLMLLFFCLCFSVKYCWMLK